MELYKEYLAPNLGAVEKAGMLALYMSGAVPTTEAELKAAIDIYDFQDMYAKCCGVSLLTMTGAAGQSLALSQAPTKVAMKKCAFDFGVSVAVGNLMPADMKRAPLPDRMFLCNVAAPNARASNIGASSFWANNVAPWLFFEGSFTHIYPTNPGRTEMFDGGLTTVVEFEWDNPRNFGGVIRSSNYGAATYGVFGVMVEAWNGAAWEVVRPTVTVGYNSLANAFTAFTKRIVTTKLRLTVTLGRTISNNCFPHAFLPIEVTADAPAPVAPPDITWALLLPMVGLAFPIYTTALSRLTEGNPPVPLYACRVGGPGESAPAVDMVLSKCRGLTVTDLPALSGIRLLTNNLTE